MTLEKLATIVWLSFILQLVATFFIISLLDMELGRRLDTIERKLFGKTIEESDDRTS